MKRSYVLIYFTLTTLIIVTFCDQSENSTTDIRVPRQVEIPRDRRFMRLFLDQNQQLRRSPQISARSDRFPPRIGFGPGPGTYSRPQFGRPVHQAVLPSMKRRVYSGPPGPHHPGLFIRPNGPSPHQSFKNTRFSFAKDTYLPKGLPVSYRPGHIPPNSIPESHSFKPSQVYNGEVIVRRPSAASLKSPSNEKLEAIRRFKNQNYPDLNHMYSVHEDTDNEQDNSHPNSNVGENAMKQAKQFLNFMSSSEYFLPKIEPDYRKLDQSNHHQQKQSDSLAQNSYPQQHRIPESNGPNNAFTVNAPLRVSSSFPQTQAQSTNSISHSSTYSNRFSTKSNLGSYQPDSNGFVVSSDGKKNVHSIAATSLNPEATHQRQNNVLNFQDSQRPVLQERVSVSSDPERVEFTERDAIHVSYTSNPMDSMSRNGENHFIQQQQHSQQSQADRRYSKPTPVQDDEDEEEIMQAASDVYGRAKVNTQETPSNPSTEQKDTEEYCERICSNLQDEDEEVVCGSDGFMYTSEAQMECYASCLHIDVTIQSKGTCNQPL